MTFRLSALARSMMVAALLIASLAMLAPMGAAQSDRGLIDETSYQSPQFGYSVTWGDPWEARDRDVITNPGGFDTITLRSIDGTVRISGRSDEYDPLTFLQDTIAIQLASGGEVINQDTTGPVPTAELLIGREQMRIDVISLPESGAIVLISLRADERDFDAALASAQESIQIEGNPIFDLAAQAQTPVTTGTVTTETPAAAETATAESTQEVLGTGIEGDTYTSPNFGFSISWDPTIWTVPEEAEYSEPDFDFLRLESATGPITVSGWNAYSGDPASCLVGEQTYYSDPEAGISEWQVAVDADGNELTGQSETNAWGVYTNGDDGDHPGYHAGGDGTATGRHRRGDGGRAADGHGRPAGGRRPDGGDLDGCMAARRGHHDQRAAHPEPDRSGDRIPAARQLRRVR
jgi:hypothetical protein